MNILLLWTPLEVLGRKILKNFSAGHLRGNIEITMFSINNMNTDKQTSSGVKILIADDSQFMRGVLKDIFSSEGYEIIEAENGKEALDKFQIEKPDLALLDIIMPEVDGMEVLKKIGKSAKVIVISAVGQEKMVEEAKGLGALDYIVKPFDNNKVLEVVKAALE